MLSGILFMLSRRWIQESLKKKIIDKVEEQAKKFYWNQTILMYQVNFLSSAPRQPKSWNLEIS